MRDGGFEVILESQNGVLNEHFINGKWYAAAVNGDTYKVKITIYRNQNGLFPCEHLKIGLFVDGYDAGNWKRVTLPADAWGDRHVIIEEFSDYYLGDEGTRAFVFGPLERKANVEEDSKEIHFGCVRVEIFEAYISDVEHEKKPFSGRIAPETRCIEETKKFWQTASVTTVGGDIIPGTAKRLHDMPVKRSGRPHYKWCTTFFEPMVTLTLHYHTPDMIRFLTDFYARQTERNEQNIRSLNNNNPQRQHITTANVASSLFDGYQYYITNCPSESGQNTEVEYVDRLLHYDNNNVSQRKRKIDVINLD